MNTKDFNITLVKRIIKEYKGVEIINKESKEVKYIVETYENYPDHNNLTVKEILKNVTIRLEDIEKHTKQKTKLRN